MVDSNIRRATWLASIAILCVASSCDFKGPTDVAASNATLVFYGKVVDQVGKPVPGARVSYNVYGYPSNFSMDPKTRAYLESVATGVSDADGNVELKVTGFQMNLREVTADGFAHLYETKRGDSVQSCEAYRFISSRGVMEYRNDKSRPAIFVLVARGVNEVSVLPSEGGWRNLDPGGWKASEPCWPARPSIKNVVYIGSITTRPTVVAPAR